jgi:hypothetical protein
MFPAAVFTPRVSIDLSDRFDRACRKAGIAQKEVAHSMKSSPELIYQQARGIGYLGMQRFEVMAKKAQETGDAGALAFLQEWLLLTAEAWGLPLASAARVGLAVREFMSGQPEMDRAQAAEVEERKFA